MKNINPNLFILHEIYFNIMFCTYVGTLLDIVKRTVITRVANPWGYDTGPDPHHWITDQDQDPALFSSSFQDVKN